VQTRLKSQCAVHEEYAANIITWKLL